MRGFLGLLGVAVAGITSLAACGGGGTTTTGCERGSANCACRGGGTCDDGLVCEDGSCVAEANGAAGSAGSSAEPAHSAGCAAPETSFASPSSQFHSIDRNTISRYFVGLTAL